MRKIKSVEHIWCDSDDRWVYIERYDNGGTGLNFMQGDEYEEFKKNWCKVDKGLSEFYEQMKITIPIQKQSESNIGFINTVMWVYLSAIANHEVKFCGCSAELFAKVPYSNSSLFEPMRLKNVEG